MKNRAMILCLKHNIKTIEEYARKIGVSPERAELILTEKAVLTDDEINANCIIFDISRDYFLALVE